VTARTSRRPAAEPTARTRVYAAHPAPTAARGFELESTPRGVSGGSTRQLVGTAGNASFGVLVGMYALVVEVVGTRSLWMAFATFWMVVTP
jgi:hypothetical protein